jgi:4-amino-4-deoxy-L-arabinose transferase-like glycosyltransferase
VRDEVAQSALRADVRGAAETGGPSRMRRRWVPGPAHNAAAWVLPAAIVLLALTVRVGVVAADGGYHGANDSAQYDYFGRSIAGGYGYPPSGYLIQGGPSAIRGPVYPYFLGALYAMSGDSFTAGRIAGAALGALAVLLLYLLTRRIWGRRVGLTAAAMAAVFPPLVLLNKELLSEPLFIVFELAALLCVLNFRRAGGAVEWAVGAGLLCGLAALTKDVGIVLVPAIALGVWTQRPRFGARGLAAPAVVVACTGLVILPWIVRNANDFGRFVPLSTNGGFTAAGTYNQESLHDNGAHAGWRTPQAVPEDMALFATPGVDEGDLDATLRRRALDLAWQHPGYAAEASAWNLLRLFEIAGGSVVDTHGAPVTARGIGSATPGGERAGIALATALAVLGIFGIVRSGRARSAGEPPRIPHGPLYLWLVPVLVIAAATPLLGLPRYRLPADPFLLILAAIGAVWLWDRWTVRTPESAAR